MITLKQKKKTKNPEYSDIDKKTLNPLSIFQEIKAFN